MADVIFNQDLEKEMKNDDIRRLQELLATDPEVYPEALITGYFGDKTEEAVKHFQLKHGVIQTPDDDGAGRVGPKTRQMLQNIFCNVPASDSETLMNIKVNLPNSDENEGEQILQELENRKGQRNNANDGVTKQIRKFIRHEFKFPDDPNYETTVLQCTEYVQFKVLKQLGIKIDWTGRVGKRDGGNWPAQFITLKRYAVLDYPKTSCAMSFPTVKPGGTGHIAFVEEVKSDGTVRITEANIPADTGTYNERQIPKNIWEAKGVKFVDFS